jgi:hypothetical protein
LEDIEVSGGRVLDVALIRRVLLGADERDFDGAGRVGDESVKSSSSGSALDGRKFGGAGMGVVSVGGSTSRSLVGVADARHVSKVVCLVFPGDEATEVPRGARAVWLGLV